MRRISIGSSTRRWQRSSSSSGLLSPFTAFATKAPRSSFTSGIYQHHRFVPLAQLVNKRFASSAPASRSESTHDVDVSTTNDFVFGEDESMLGGGAAASSAAEVVRGHQSSLAVPNAETLGVVRKVPLKPGTELSRFGIPIAEPRRGIAPPRQGSRSSVGAGDRVAKVEDEESTSSALATSDALADGDAGSSSSSSSPPPTQDLPLPHDDQWFAQRILEMEVEGAIDENWQDHRKAHFEDVEAIVNILKEMRVRDIAVVDTSSKTSHFDYLVMGTCEGPRHIHLAAWSVQESDSRQRVSKIKRQMTDELWECVPVGRIVVNLMQESYREQVTLERKWAVTKCMDPLDAANAPISEGRQVKAHGLWTLTLNLQDLEDYEVDYCKDALMAQL